MNATNRTSLAVQKLNQWAITLPETSVGLAPHELKAIAQKYGRIETELRNGQQRYCASQCLKYPGQGHTTACQQMEEAISFDPLSE